MDEMDFTRKFRLGDQRDLEIKAILTTVYQALQELSLIHIYCSRGERRPSSRQIASRKPRDTADIPH